ncbi:SGNH/GDSL hydrolase family protein [Actinoalloteichus caeruleus]|uniref:SGNH/GDSL hydrolase family protein n=1 Tax=Actinoalloteichus cyanogriseus TaxID=2893586 RepID=UPI000A99117B|nr:SGNH/GDSL hydrolase family protein [Actinoalloteichus caeruleus]
MPESGVVTLVGRWLASNGWSPAQGRLLITPLRRVVENGKTALVPDDTFSVELVNGRIPHRVTCPVDLDDAVETLLHVEEHVLGMRVRTKVVRVEGPVVDLPRAVPVSLSVEDRAVVRAATSGAPVSEAGSPVAAMAAAGAGGGEAPPRPEAPLRPVAPAHRGTIGLGTAGASLLTGFAGQLGGASSPPGTSEVRPARATVPGLWQWGRAWSQTGLRKVRVVAVGSSSTQGVGASHIERSFVSRLGQILGEPGRHYPAADGGWLSSGVPLIVDADLGFRSRRLLGGEWIERDLPSGTTLLTVFHGQGSNNGSFEVSVDGGAPVSVIPDRSGQADRADGEWTSPPLPPGTRTVRITAREAVTISGVYAHTDSAGTGIQVFIAGKGGTQSGNYLPSRIMGSHCDRVARLDPDLIVIQLGANDYAAGVAPEVYAERMRQQLNLYRTVCSRRPSILLLHTFRRFDVTTPAHRWEDYARAAHQLAKELDDVAVIDVSAHFPVTQDVDDADMDLVHVDRIHLSDAGHGLTARLIADQLRLPLVPRSAPPTPDHPVGRDPAANRGVVVALRASELDGGPGDRIAEFTPHQGTEPGPRQEREDARPELRVEAGRWFLRFDRVDGPRWMQSPAWSRAHTPPVTVFLVARPRDVHGTWVSGHSGSYLAWFTAGNPLCHMMCGAGGLSAPDAATVWTGVGRWNVFAAVFDGERSRHLTYGHEVTRIVTGTGPAASLPGLTLATNAATTGVYADIDIADLVVVDRAFTDTELQGGADWLARHYRLDQAGRTSVTAGPLSAG